MTRAGDFYEATIPPSDVTPSGLAYYIEATDGYTTATYPAVNPAGSPQVVTLSPGEPPPGDANKEHSCDMNTQVSQFLTIALYYLIKLGCVFNQVTTPLVRVEVRSEFRLRDVTGCLSDDSSQCSSIKFRMNGNSQGLFFSGSGYPA